MSTAATTVGPANNRSSSNSCSSDASSEEGSSASSSGISGDALSSSSPPDSPESDLVYMNKQLIAHLLRYVCSEPAHNNNNFYGENPSYEGGAGAPVSQRHQQQQQSNGISSSRSPGDEVVIELHQPPVTQQNPQNQRSQLPQQQQHEHQQSQSSGSSSSDFLAVASTQSYSNSYISPFAQSPISERSAWYRPAISLVVVKDQRTQELEQILLQLCEEFEHRLHDKFEDFGAKLDTKPETIRESVTREMETLFYDDSVHWGRVIAVFVLCREICNKCAGEGRPELRPAVQQWVAEFIDARLWDWMRDNQGWFGLVKFYRETGGDKAVNSGGVGNASIWNPVASLLTISAVSIGIALAAAYFRR